MDIVKTSKFLSLVLRHQPQTAHITLDEAGWTDVDALLDGAARAGRRIDMDQLCEVVDENDKQRFEFNADMTKIRARQGHSVAVELGYAPSAPPELLYHGTVPGSLPAIRAGGLQKMRRHAVHLSPDLATATRVGQRRGQPCILTVRAAALHATGAAFYRTENNVWLTEQVPPEFIGFPPGA